MKIKLGIRTLEEVKISLYKTPQQGEPFNLGDKVDFTNIFGVTFENLTVIGFSYDGVSTNTVHLDASAYWAPVSATLLKHSPTNYKCNTKNQYV